MLVAHAFHSLAYTVVSITPIHLTVTWATAAANCVDWVYVVVLIAYADQVGVSGCFLSRACL